MEENPYAVLVECMQSIAAEQEGLCLYIATVAGVSPISISLAGQILGGGNLLVDAELKVPKALAVGDRVAVLTADSQLYTVLCKVVSA